MTPPILRVNNLFNRENEIHPIDTISKVFIIFELFLGLNRVSLIGGIKYFFNILATIYTLLLYCCLFCLYYYEDNNNMFDDIILFSVQYLFCTIFSLVSCRRMRLYLSELEVFDKIAGCKPKVTTIAIKNIIAMPLIVLSIAQWYALPYFSDAISRPFLYMFPVHVIYTSEVYFYAHLLNLINPRVRFINHCVKVLGNEARVSTDVLLKNYVFESNRRDGLEMSKLMDLYYTVIKAYEYLIDAIKWQLMIILLTSFITNLRFSYHISLEVIRNYNSILDTLSDSVMMAVKLISLFAPCLLGDKLHGEVKKLRELLASKLYENKLNKSSRSTARALLALTEARDLSFSLLKMFRVDISLPFKFVGLLITYLIILLQFEKVINP